MIRFSLLLMFVFTLTVSAQRLEFAPGATYDQRLPTLKQVTGFALGEHVTPPEEITQYLKALQAAAPERTRLIEYARTWEGRPLYALIIASPENAARFDAIQSGMQQLAHPQKLSATEAEKLVRELPLIVALMHGVHGNEISSGEAALAEAYHLLAATNDDNVKTILANCVVLIDPMQNPDGRARFVYQNLLGRAASPDAEPAAAEHDEPWPGGRSNHYLFDLNRDWFVQTQPESQGRTKLLREWPAQVAIDLHEMGGDSTYYFPPASQPYNPYLTKAQLDWYESFGKANAARFDERGFAYFNREVFDAFYPGYGVSWPSAQGALGMTFEMASARGLLLRRVDGTSLTYLDGAVRHFTSAMTTALMGAKNRERLLRDFLAFRRTAGEGATKAYILVPGGDTAHAERLAKLLIDNDITVQRANEGFSIGARNIAAGAFIIPLPQPGGMLARNLLDQNVALNAEFMQQQEARRQRRLPDQIYDITAWNLPLMHDVECLTAERALTVKATELRSDDLANPLRVEPLAKAIVGYALPWNATSAAVVLEALHQGMFIEFLAPSFTIAGRKFERGTAFLRKAENASDMPEKLNAIAARHHAEIITLNSAFIDEGVSLGSNQTMTLKTPRVLLAWDAPASSLSAGWARYVLERRFAQSVTAVRVSSLARVDWRRYDVIVLPSGNYATALNADVIRRLKDWMNAGGTLITVSEASRWAALEATGLLDTRTEMRDGKAPNEAAEKPPVTQTFFYDKAIQPLREAPENTPGALLRVKLDEDHWLSSGTDGEVQALVEGTRVFTPIKLDKGRNVGIYGTPNNLLASGFMWPDSAKQLPQKSFLIHQPYGQGHLIAFAEDPNYRAYVEGTIFLFINAVLLGAAY